MKDIVRGELEREGYRVVEESLFPPAGWISWSTYRPDLLGFRKGRRKEEVAIVECETRPSMNRFRSKNYSSLWFQPSLLNEGSIRRVLAVPRGRLRAVDLRLRNEWEIWVMGERGPTVRLSRVSRPAGLLGGGQVDSYSSAPISSLTTVDHAADTFSGS
ncbi:MAG: hypothetical protein LYZ69_05840 [Nitrososphaerales archaeon]|nr:hypothetical protein [Nitrososphaerales archaeon]